MTEAPQTIIYSAKAAGRPALFFEDLLAGIRKSQVWRAFAWDETQQRYQRSIFGVLWIVFSYALFVGGIALFFAEFSSLGVANYVMYVAVGYAAFQFLVGNVVDGCQVFNTSSAWIKSTPLPYSIYVYKSIFRSAFPFALQLALSLAIMIVLGWRPSWLALMAIPALAVYIINGIAIQYFLGLVGARFRDINHLIGAVTRLMIFITPIIWVREERTGPGAIFADANPLTHYIEIFRSPILGSEARLMSWGIVLGLTVLIWLAAAVASARMRRRLPFWV